MEKKEHTQYPSRYKIGELVDFIIPKNKEEKKELYRIPAYIRGIFFVTGKVRYSLFFATINSTIHNVDSVFVEDSTIDDFDKEIEFEPITYC